MEMIFDNLAKLAAVAGCFCSIAAALALCVKPIRDKFFGLREIADGLKCTLRSDILRTYYQNHEQDAIRQYELENLHKSYKAYKALGGNSFIDDLYKEMRTWEVND